MKYFVDDGTKTIRCAKTITEKALAIDVCLVLKRLFPAAVFFFASSVIILRVCGDVMKLGFAF